MNSGPRKIQLGEFEASPAGAESTRPVDAVENVALTLQVELGRTQRAVKDLLHLQVGSVLPLNKEVGDCVEISLNQKTVARGEVIEIEGQYGVRVTEITS